MKTIQLLLINVWPLLRYGSPTPSEYTTLDSTTSGDLSPLKGSLALNPLAPSITSVANMAGLSVAKAISLSKLVHEISSQASIASLKSASLPPSQSDDRTSPDNEPNTPPPTQPLPQIPSAQFHNTSEFLPP